LHFWTRFSPKRFSTGLIFTSKGLILTQSLNVATSQKLRTQRLFEYHFLRRTHILILAIIPNRQLNNYLSPFGHRSVVSALVEYFLQHNGECTSAY